MRWVRFIVAAFVVLGLAPATAEAPLKIVASFTILADMTARVGGDLVEVSSLVGPGGDVHVFDPLPTHARALREADLAIANGLGFEAFLDGLIEASNYEGPVLRLGERIAGIGDDPHAWHDPAKARKYVSLIAAMLITLDPVHEEEYRANALAYIAEIKMIDAEIKAVFENIPPARRLIVTSHDAFGHFGAAFGLTVKGAGGISTSTEPSARDIAELVGEIRQSDVGAVFVETLVNPALIEQVARETGTVVGGVLYGDTLSEPDGAAPTYLEMMRHNAATIAAALTGG